MRSLLLFAVACMQAPLIAAQTPAQPESTESDTIAGRLVDTKGAPVPGAAVLLFESDSTYVDAVASNLEGRFEIRSALRPYRLQVQHLAYELCEIESDRPDLGDIVLAESQVSIDAVVVEGERPVVRVEQGRLNYDLGQLTRNQAVNNAYEALTRLPGVSEQDGALSLAGASSVTVILNGRPSTMTSEQLAALLRSTPGRPCREGRGHVQCSAAVSCARGGDKPRHAPQP